AYSAGQGYGQNPSWLDHSRGGYGNDANSPSLLKPGQTPSFSMRPTGQLFDVESPSVDRLMVAVDDDQVKSSSFLKDKGVSGFELVVVEEGEKASLSLEELAVVEAPSVQEAPPS
nr:hypothetical protein [Tanacetum cinerariifolium]